MSAPAAAASLAHVVPARVSDLRAWDPIPAVICGPGHVAQARQPNEWVSLAQLAQCEAFMQRLADRACV
jgi:acetylornithine deacetylase/succinyl-diaminopimelate desuccinylase-like protein